MQAYFGEGQSTNVHSMMISLAKLNGVYSESSCSGCSAVFLLRSGARREPPRSTTSTYVSVTWVGTRANTFVQLWSAIQRLKDALDPMGLS